MHCVLQSRGGAWKGAIRDARRRSLRKRSRTDEKRAGERFIAEVNGKEDGFKCGRQSRKGDRTKRTTWKGKEKNKERKASVSARRTKGLDPEFSALRQREPVHYVRFQLRRNKEGISRLGIASHPRGLTLPICEFIVAGVLYQERHGSVPYSRFS